MIIERKYFKNVIRPEGIYTYNKRNKNYILSVRDPETGDVVKEPISKYKYRKAIREERQEWKSSTEDF